MGLLQSSHSNYVTKWLMRDAETDPFIKWPYNKRSKGFQSLLYVLVQSIFLFPSPYIFNLVKNNHTLLKESGRGDLGDDDSCSASRQSFCQWQTMIPTPPPQHTQKISVENLTLHSLRHRIGVRQNTFYLKVGWVVIFNRREERSRNLRLKSWLKDGCVGSRWDRRTVRCGGKK